MLGVVQGFALILSIIGIGYLIGLFGVVKGEQRRVLNVVAFYVASPALLFDVLQSSDPSVLISPVVLVTSVSAVAAAALFVLASRIWFRRDLATTALGATTAGYINANNLGLPVAIYILGDAAYVAPILIMQLLVFAPTLLTVLESTRGNRRGALAAVGRAVTNPIILASAAGLVFSLAGWQLPQIALDPIQMLGAAAIPMVLLSFGISLHGQRALQPGSGRSAVLTASIIKLIAMPLIAWLMCLALGVSAHETFVAVTVAALPTAQNVYNYAATYRRGEIIVRDTIMVTTFASLVVIAFIAWIAAA
ncbi:MAG: AEC family transporter [Microbacteriaceae bacterium]|nr:AEC family transporter [Microbacteriaceae bacterium]